MINCDWLKNINDSTPISNLALLGTHHSATGCKWNKYDFLGKVCNFIVKHQNKTINEQLTKGIRFLDINLNNCNNDLYVCSNFSNINILFSDIIRDCIDFLDRYKSEFILIRIKKEECCDNINNSFNVILNKILQEYNDRIVISNKPQTVKSLRGKIMITSIENINHDYNFPPQYGFTNYSRKGDDNSCFKQYLDIVKTDLDDTSWEKDILCI
ncbi:MAG: phosphatidylinositol-specific phospholipase C domain-containing protein, partial [Clostridia bacterium]